MRFQDERWSAELGFFYTCYLPLAWLPGHPFQTPNNYLPEIKIIFLCGTNEVEDKRAQSFPMSTIQLVVPLAKPFESIVSK